jgi:hypothetical protein
MELTVGTLPCPPGRQPPRPPTAAPPAALLDPHEIATELADPAVVRSGYTLRHGLLLRNSPAANSRSPRMVPVRGGAFLTTGGRVRGSRSGWPVSA